MNTVFEIDPTNLERIRVQRALLTLQEFKACYDAFLAAKEQGDLPAEDLGELERLCRNSMIRMLTEEHPVWEKILECSPKKIRSFIRDLDHATWSNSMGHFPTLRGTYWAWPPSRELLDYVDAWIDEHSTALAFRNV